MDALANTLVRTSLGGVLGFKLSLPILIDFDSIPEFSPVLFLGSCLVFVCTLASFHRRSRGCRYLKHGLLPACKSFRLPLILITTLLPPRSHPLL
jgi:hypothetical protein